MPLRKPINPPVNIPPKLITVIICHYQLMRLLQCIVCCACLAPLVPWLIYIGTVTHSRRREAESVLSWMSQQGFSLIRGGGPFFCEPYEVIWGGPAGSFWTSRDWTSFSQFEGKAERTQSLIFRSTLANNVTRCFPPKQWNKWSRSAGRTLLFTDLCSLFMLIKTPNCKTVSNIIIIFKDVF